MLSRSELHCYQVLQNVHKLLTDHTNHAGKTVEEGVGKGVLRGMVREGGAEKDGG